MTDPGYILIGFDMDAAEHRLTEARKSTGVEFNYKTWKTQPGAETLEVITDLIEKAYAKGYQEAIDYGHLHVRQDEIALEYHDGYDEWR